MHSRLLDVDGPGLGIFVSKEGLASLYLYTDDPASHEAFLDDFNVTIYPHIDSLLLAEYLSQATVGARLENDPRNNCDSEFCFWVSADARKCHDWSESLATRTAPAAIVSRIAAPFAIAFRRM